MHRKGTLKISMNLSRDGKALLSPEFATAILLGCHKTLRDLGNLANTVEVIRVTFEPIPGHKEWGPRFETHFSDPMGEKGSHVINLGSVGTIGPSPTADDIVEVLSRYLPGYIRDHLLRSQHTLAEIQTRLNELRS